MKALSLAVGLVVGCGGSAPRESPANPLVAEPERCTTTPLALELAPWLSRDVARTEHVAMFVTFDPDLAAREHAEPPVRDYVAFDSRTRALLRVNQATQAELAADERHMVVIARDKLVVYDLASGAALVPPTPIAGRFTLRSNELWWAARTGGDYQVHRRDLTAGADLRSKSSEERNGFDPADLRSKSSEERNGFDPADLRSKSSEERNGFDPEVYRGLPAGPDAPELTLDGDRVLATTRAAIRVWSGEPDKPIFAFDGANQQAELAADGLTFLRGDDTPQLVHVSLHGADPTPIKLMHHAQCGDGSSDGGYGYIRCQPDRYLVRSGRWLCVWDTARGRLQTKIPSPGDEYHCLGDEVWARQMPTFGDYDHFSAVTGLRRRGPHQRLSPVPAPASVDPLTIQSANPGSFDVGAPGARAARTPTPSAAATVAFGPRGELVVAGYAGELWRVALPQRTVSFAAIADCALTSGAPLVIASDGRVAAACRRDHRRELRLEGSSSPIHVGRDFEGSLVTAHGAVFAWIGHSELAVPTAESYQAWSVPDGGSRWRHEMEVGRSSSGLAITRDGERFAAGDPITVYDAHAKRLAITELTGAALAFSPTGGLLAVAAASWDRANRGKLFVVDAMTGRLRDEFAVAAAIAAWDPSGRPRVAYWGRSGLTIRDVESHLETVFAAPCAATRAPAAAIAWSGDRLAVVVDRAVLLWDGRIEDHPVPSRLGFFRRGAVELRPDHRAVLLGEPAASRELLVCRRGDLGYPSAAGCEALIDAAGN